MNKQATDKTMKGFTMFHNDHVNRNAHLQGPHFKVYAVIASYAYHPKVTCDPSIAAISKGSGYCREYVRKIIGDLVEWEYLDTDHRNGSRIKFILLDPKAAKLKNRPNVDGRHRPIADGGDRPIADGPKKTHKKTLKKSKIRTNDRNEKGQFVKNGSGNWGQKSGPRPDNVAGIYTALVDAYWKRCEVDYSNAPDVDIRLLERALEVSGWSFNRLADEVTNAFDNSQDPLNFTIEQFCTELIGYKQEREMRKMAMTSDQTEPTNGNGRHAAHWTPLTKDSNPYPNHWDVFPPKPIPNVLAGQCLTPLTPLEDRIQF